MGAVIRLVAPNPRLQRTPSAPLSRQPLGDTRSGACGVESSFSRAPRLREPGEDRRSAAATTGPASRIKSRSSPNPRLQRTRAALLLGVLARRAGKAIGGRRVPLKRKPLGDAKRFLVLPRQGRH